MADGPWNDFKQSSTPPPKHGAGPWDDFATTKQVPTASAPAAGDASGTMGATGKPPDSFDVKGMAREGALGLASGFTGLPESQTPIKDIANASQKGDLGYQLGQRAAGDPNAPSYLDMVKQHNPLTGAIDTVKGLYGAGKEIATAPDQAGIAHGVGSFIGQLLQLSALMKGGDKTVTPETTAAARAIERHSAINQGQVIVSKGQVKAPIEMLDAAVNAEVGKHVNAVLAADELHNKITNNPAGYVNSVEAANVATKKSEQIGGEFANKVGKLIERANTGPMTMREAKALTTDVGREAARAANGREAAVLNELYDGLHDATASRADDLGSAYAKSWQHYIDETRSMKDMKSGVLGKLQDEPNHAKVLDMMTDPDNSVALKEIGSKMKQYGVDPKPFTQAQEVATDLKNASEQSRNMFQGKIRAIMKYPYAAGPGAAGAAVVARVSGIPGMSFVLPLIVAAKIGGMLDNAAIRNILKDIEKRVPAEMNVNGESVNTRQIHEPGSGPMPTPPPPSGAGITAPTPKEATPGQVEDMATAQDAEESRQAKARRVRSVYKGKRR